MQRRAIVRLVGVAVVAALGAAACSSSRGSTSTTTAAPTATTASAGATTTAAPAKNMFGTLPSPCGPGTAKGATDQGVTDTAIRIGYGDDRGFAGSPGLDQEMGDAVKAMIKWCNDQGGINGRQIVGRLLRRRHHPGQHRDAAGVQDRLHARRRGLGARRGGRGDPPGCNLAAVPGFTVGPDFANGPEMYQAVPNPVDYLPASPYYQMAKLFPNAMASSTSSTPPSPRRRRSTYAKDNEAAVAAGLDHILNCGVTINYNGEPDYKPFAQKFLSCGAKLIYNDLGPGPLLFGMLQAMNQLGVKPIYIMETNDYTTELSPWNTQGIGDNIYVRDAFQPLENAADGAGRPAVPRHRQGRSAARPASSASRRPRRSCCGRPRPSPAARP